MTVLLEMEVPGNPETKGSTKAFVVRRKNGVMGAAITNDNPDARAWEHRISYFARQTITKPRPGPMFVRAYFRFRRPKSHLLKSVDSAGRPRLAKDVSEAHVQKPDVDKLGRVVLDALTGVVYDDDAQVVGVELHKAWTVDGESGVHIRVEEAHG